MRELLRAGMGFGLFLPAFFLALLAPWTHSQEQQGASPNTHKVLFLGVWDRAQPLLDRVGPAAGFEVQFVNDAAIGSLSATELAAADVILVLNLHPDVALALQTPLAAMHAAHPQLPILALDERDSQKGLERKCLLQRDATLQTYWRNGGAENFRRMFTFLACEFLGDEGSALPPVVVPSSGVWHSDAPQVFTNMDDFLQWQKERKDAGSGAHIAIATQRSFVFLEDIAVHRAMVEELEARGLQVAVMFSDQQAKFLQMLKRWQPELLLDDGHASPMLLAGAAELDIPQMKVISMLRSTLSEWQDSPMGLEPGDIGLHLTTQEVYGIADPQIVGGMTAHLSGYRLHEPEKERIAHMADRAESWLQLRRKENAEKRIAIMYYHKHLGGSDLVRGSPSGAFLDGPASLFLLLQEMQSKGYRIDPMPESAEQLLDWLRKRGRNIGTWADGDKKTFVAEGNPVLLPVGPYRRWFQNIPAQAQEQVLQTYGAAPGKQMSWRENEKDYFLIPRLDLGGVVLLPQPARGPENDPKLLHARDIPPPHQYLATYFWLQKQAKIDAIVHFGTHGSELLLPLRGTGLGPTDFGDIVLGALPNITPWILDNVAEATLAKRRAYAVLVDHQVPAYEAAGLSPELLKLQGDLQKFVDLEEGTVRSRYQTSIVQLARQQGLTTPAEESLFDQTLAREMMEELESIRGRVAPMHLHTLGVPPDTKRLTAMVTTMLGSAFSRSYPNREAAEQDVAAAINQQSPTATDSWQAKAQEYAQRLLHTEDEVGNILHALNGNFIPPGPGNDPLRNPSAVPTGRNMYALNPEEIPTPTAWAIGVELGDKLLERGPLRKVAFDLNAFETMRDYGVMEAEILYLMGVRPIWDENGLAADVEVISREELGRPRVDVFVAISGAMRDNFPSRIRLFDRAVRMVADLDEADNQVRSATLSREQTLLEEGYAPKQAKLLAAARIFGQKPGEYGTRILYMVPKSGSWDSRDEIADVYMNTMSHVYTADLWGEKIDGLYRHAIAGSDLVLRNWASNMMSPLSNHHVYEYAGGLSLALSSVDGKQPELLINDVREQPKLRDFDAVMQEEFHATLLNRKWVSGMKENGYAGAGQMAELVKNSFGWESVRAGAVGQAMWDGIDEVYLQDRYELDLQQWFDHNNPHAQQEIAASLLEANRKEYWQADPQRLQEIAKLYAQSVVNYKLSGGLVDGGNVKLQEQVTRFLNDAGEAALATAYLNQVAASAGKPVQNQVRGMELAAKEKTPPTPAQPTNSNNEISHYSWFAAAAFLGLFLFGFRRRLRHPKC
jgi:cobaltochelatase CobN